MNLKTFESSEEIRVQSCPEFGLAHVTPSEPLSRLCMTGRGESSGDFRGEIEEGKGVGVRERSASVPSVESMGEDLRLAAKVQVLETANSKVQGCWKRFSASAARGQAFRAGASLSGSSNCKLMKPPKPLPVNQSPPGSPCPWFAAWLAFLTLANQTTS